MVSQEQDIINLVKTGTTNVEELRTQLGAQASNDVSLSDWRICYSSVTGQLSGFCTVIANDSDNPVTGVGVIMYSADGITMYALTYTNGFSSPMVMPSTGTNLYNPSMGNQSLCIVYGTTTSGTYFFIDTLNIDAC